MPRSRRLTAVAVPARAVLSLLLAVSAATLDRAAAAARELECGLYIAESTIPGAGLGIFAGHAYQKGQYIGRGDVCIPFVDMYW